MKKLLLISCLLLIAMTGFSQTAPLTVNVKFINVEDGYDHETKTAVFIDGQEIGVSPVTTETKTVSFTVNVPTGTHSLKIVNYAMYEGNWEEHSIENDYSIDVIYEEDHTFKKPEKFFILVDLDDDMMVSWKKPVKVKK
ncbi:MAG: hypothetical protein PSV36_11465 [Algoriphagus sp.]|nr:hypothetical protein [Algoriphagus sp.]